MITEINVNDFFVHKKTNDLIFVTKIARDTKLNRWVAFVKTRYENMFTIVAIQNLGSYETYKNEWFEQ